MAEKLVLTIHQELPDHQIARDFMTSPMPTLVTLAGGNDADLDQFTAAVIGFNIPESALLVAVPSDVLDSDEPKILEFYADGDDYVCEYTPDSGGGGEGTTIFMARVTWIEDGESDPVT